MACRRQRRADHPELYDDFMKGGFWLKPYQALSIPSPLIWSRNKVFNDRPKVLVEKSVKQGHCHTLRNGAWQTIKYWESKMISETSYTLFSRLRQISITDLLNLRSSNSYCCHQDEEFHFRQKKTPLGDTSNQLKNISNQVVSTPSVAEQHLKFPHLSKNKYDTFHNSVFVERTSLLSDTMHQKPPLISCGKASTTSTWTLRTFHLLHNQLDLDTFHDGGSL